MSPGLSWQLHLHLPPRRVFAALINATARHAREQHVDESDRALTFVPSTFTVDPAARLRARVHPAGDGGSLLVLDPVDGGGLPVNASLEAESISSLVRDLRDELQLAAPESSSR
jgi:hypothetical protein